MRCLLGLGRLEHGRLKLALAALDLGLLDLDLLLALDPLDRLPARRRPAAA